MTAVKTRPTAVSTPPAPEDHGQDAIDAAWEQYHKDKSERSRDVLLEAHLPLIQRVVDRISRRLPSEVDPGDLQQEGVFGLMHAIDRFDPERGVRFSTFATQSINSAVLDYLRSIDWAPRLARSRSRKLNTARQSLTKTLGREPDEDELFDEMGMERKEFLLTVRDGRLTSTVSLAAGADAPDAEGGYTGLGQVLVRPVGRLPRDRNPPPGPQGPGHRQAQPGRATDRGALLLRAAEHERDRRHAGSLRVTRQPDALLDHGPPEGPAQGTHRRLPRPGRVASARGPVAATGPLANDAATPPLAF